jgi:hypothetical protein
VLSEKMSPRESSSGRKYGVWKITNLGGFTCSLFLFGDAFESHWKETEGSIVGVLNAKYKEQAQVRLLLWLPFQIFHAGVRYQLLPFPVVYKGAHVDGGSFDFCWKESEGGTRGKRRFEV